MRRRERLVYVAAAIAVVAIGIAGARHAFALERALEWVRGTGWAAVAALLGALLATPAARITERLTGRRPRVGPTRRALGISAAVLGGLHASVALATYLDGEWRGLLDRAWLRAGVLALAVLIPLLVTSHPRLVRALRIQLWKPLHRLAYAAAILALLHVLGAPLADRGTTLVVFGAALAVWLLRFLPYRRATPSHSRSQSES